MWFNVFKGSDRRSKEYNAGLEVKDISEVDYAELGFPLPIWRSKSSNRWVGTKQLKKLYHTKMHSYYLVAWRFSVAGLRKTESLSMARKHKVAAQNIEPMPGTRYRATYDRHGNNVESLQPRPPEEGMVWNYELLEWGRKHVHPLRKAKKSIHFATLRQAIKESIKVRDKHIIFTVDLLDSIRERYGKILEEKNLMTPKSISGHVTRLNHVFLRNSLAKYLNRHTKFRRNNKSFFYDGIENPYRRYTNSDPLGYMFG